MDYKGLAMTLVSGVAGVTFVICSTVLLVSGVDVPKEFIPAALLLLGVSTGASNKIAG